MLAADAAVTDGSVDVLVVCAVVVAVVAPSVVADASSDITVTAAGALPTSTTERSTCTEALPRRFPCVDSVGADSI